VISAAYKAEQRRMHEDNPNYGVASVQYAPVVTMLINKLGITELLDYGCGKGRLAKSIAPDHEVKVRMYDPGISGIDEKPDSAQFVTCIDVLEHIEPEYVYDVLDDLSRVVEFYGFFTIHTGPAIKVLSDGRNAHLIQKGADWWLPLIMERFELIQFVAQPNGFYVVVKRYGN